jgi:hypothetical protein
MAKRLASALLVVLLSLAWLTAASAGVTSPPNLVGQWSGPVTIATNTSFIKGRTVTMVIATQSGPVFRGIIGFGGGTTSHPFNGVIIGDEIRATGDPTTILGKVTFSSPARIAATFQEIKNASDPLSPSTGVFYLEKVSDTP